MRPVMSPTGWRGRDFEVRTAHAWQCGRPDTAAWWCVLALALLAAACTVERGDVRTPSGRAPEADTARVLSALQDLASALATADGAALDTLLAEDLTVFRDGRLAHGVSSALEVGGAVEGEALGGRRLLFRDVSIEIADGQMAWASARYTLRSDRAGTAVGEGVATLIFERAEGAWRLTHMHLSALAESGPGSAPDEVR